MSRKTCWHCHKHIDNQNEEYDFICPHCSTHFADKPKNEAQFHLLQMKYLANKQDKDSFTKMILLIKEISYNQIVSKLKASGKFLYDEDLEDKVSWSVCKMISLYENPDFKITTSVIEYLNKVVLYPLYNYKLKDREQNEISLFLPINNHKNNNKKENTLYDLMKEKTMLEEIGEVENYFFINIEKENIINISNDFIDSILLTISENKNFSYALKMLIVIDYFFQKKNNKLFTNWWNTEGLDFKKRFDKILILFRNNIREINYV